MKILFILFYWAWIVEGYLIYEKSLSCNAHAFHLYFVSNNILNGHIILFESGWLEKIHKIFQILAFEHKINWSSSKVFSHYRVIDVYSKDICYDIFVVNKSFDFFWNMLKKNFFYFFWNMFNTNAIKNVTLLPLTYKTMQCILIDFYSSRFTAWALSFIFFVKVFGRLFLQ